MNAQQLRNSILQEAIEGRLVSQDPNDEPASALLERIREEKRRLVKEGKITLSKPEKAIKNTDKEPYVLPINWSWALVNDVCRVFGRIGFRGYTKSDLREKKEGAAISLSPSNMVNGSLDFSVCTYISEEKYEESPEIQINVGDILIVKTGSSYGKTSLVKELPWRATINPQIAVIKDIKIDLEYLKYFFQSPFAQSSFKGFVLGTSIPTFSQLNLISMFIPLPPLAEQKRIVAKIEELMPKVEEYGKAQEALDKLNAELPEKLKKSILQEAIEGRLVPQDPNDEPASVLLDKIRKEKAQLVKEGKLKKKDLISEPITDEEKPFEIPENWEWVRLQDLVSLISDGTHKTPTYKETGVPFLSVQNISSGILSLERIKYISEEEHQRLCERVKPQRGDILVCRIGTLGKAIEITWDFDFSIFVSLGLLRPINMDITPYMILFINSPAGKEWIDKVKVGGGTHTYKINLSDLPNMLIPLPPLTEQHRIVAKIEELFAEIDKLKTK